jgi:hypothetical protein
MKSISIQYQELKEGKMNRHQFLQNARRMFPGYVTNHNSLEDSIKILKSKGLLNEGDAVKGTPDKAPDYDYPNEVTKYKKVEQSPEVDEQDGIYPATTLTKIPKIKLVKKVKNTSDGLEPIKDNDTKNELKKVKVVKENKEKFDAKQHQKDDFQKFSDKIRNQVQGGPPTQTNKLKDVIKKMVREMLDEESNEQKTKSLHEANSMITLEAFETTIDGVDYIMDIDVYVYYQNEDSEYEDGYKLYQGGPVLEDFELADINEVYVYSDEEGDYIPVEDEATLKVLANKVQADASFDSKVQSAFDNLDFGDLD